MTHEGWDQALTIGAANAEHEYLICPLQEKSNVPLAVWERVHSRIHQRGKQADRSTEQIQKSCKLAMPAPGSALGPGVVDVMS